MPNIRRSGLNQPQIERLTAISLSGVVFTVINPTIIKISGCLKQAGTKKDAIGRKTAICFLIDTQIIAIFALSSSIFSVFFTRQRLNFYNRPLLPARSNRLALRHGTARLWVTCLCKYRNK